MKNLKIGKKLFITFGVILALFLVTVLVALFGLTNTGSRFEDFYTVGYPVSNRTLEMRRATQNGLKNIALSMLTDDTQETKDYVSEATSELGSLQEGFEYLQKNFTGDMALIDKAKTILNESTSSRDEILDLASKNKNTQAAELLFKTYQPKMLEFQDVLVEMDNDTTVLADDNFKQSSNSQTMVLILMIIISIISLLATVMMALYITRGLTRPIIEIEDAATKMAGGDLNVSVTYESRDELGNLSDKIRDLSQALKDIISDEDYLLGQMSNGNFDIYTKVEDRYIGDFKSILTSMRKIKTSLSETLFQINQSADQVASGSDQVSNGAQALAQGAAEQASSVEELAATINDISGQVQSNAENAGEASKVADRVGSEMTESNQKMQEMIHAMSEISKSSQEIGKIIKTIEDIAFQTNILALNAAVEAARAGEAGKGFAVVADEVRNLASKSAEASKSTSTLIENALKAVADGTSIADDTAKALIAAVEGAQNVTSIIGKISAASDEQSRSISQVTQGVDQISSVVQTNSATAEESAAASEELSGQAQILKGLVSRFQLSKLVTGNAYGQEQPATNEYEEQPAPQVSMGGSKY